MTAEKKQEAPKQKNSRTVKQPAPAAKSAEVCGVKNKTVAKQKVAAELAAELKKVRAALKETIKQISMHIDKGIADSLRVLEKKQQPGEPCNLPGAKTTAQMAKKLRALKIKPAKGKLKDIAHIERMVEKIAEKTVKKQ